MWDCYKRQKEKNKNERELSETGISMARHPVHWDGARSFAADGSPAVQVQEEKTACVSVNQASRGSHKWQQKHDKKDLTG